MPCHACIFSPVPDEIQSLQDFSASSLWNVLIWACKIIIQSKSDGDLESQDNAVLLEQIPDELPSALAKKHNAAGKLAACLRGILLYRGDIDYPAILFPSVKTTRPLLRAVLDSLPAAAADQPDAGAGAADSDLSRWRRQVGAAFQAAFASAWQHPAVAQPPAPAVACAPHARLDDGAYGDTLDVPRAGQLAAQPGQVLAAAAQRMEVAQAEAATRALIAAGPSAPGLPVQVAAALRARAAAPSDAEALRLTQAQYKSAATAARAKSRAARLEAAAAAAAVKQGNTAAASVDAAPEGGADEPGTAGETAPEEAPEAAAARAAAEAAEREAAAQARQEAATASLDQAQLRVSRARAELDQLRPAAAAAEAEFKRCKEALRLLAAGPEAVAELQAKVSKLTAAVEKAARAWEDARTPLLADIRRLKAMTGDTVARAARLAAATQELQASIPGLASSVRAAEAEVARLTAEQEKLSRDAATRAPYVKRIMELVAQVRQQSASMDSTVDDIAGLRRAIAGIEDKLDRTSARCEQMIINAAQEAGSGSSVAEAAVQVMRDVTAIREAFHALLQSVRACAELEHEVRELRGTHEDLCAANVEGNLDAAKRDLLELRAANAQLVSA